MVDLDNLKHDAKVISPDSHNVGKLHALVVDPRDDEVTHIVVNTGPFFPSPGFGAPHLVSVPVEEVADAQEDGVILKCTRLKFDELPPYVERDFLPRSAERGGGAEQGPAWGRVEAEASQQEPQQRSGGPLRAVWNVGAALAASFGSQLVGIPVPLETFRKASFEREIVYDSPVWRQEPHEQIGEVERVLIDEDTDEIEALVIRRGHVFTEDVVLPIAYVTEVLDGVVRVQLGDDEIERLERFEA